VRREQIPSVSLTVAGAIHGKVAYPRRVTEWQLWLAEIITKPEPGSPTTAQFRRSLSPHFVRYKINLRWAIRAATREGKTCQRESKVDV
ncbi:hypothetical protein PFISCL1PPCAC_15574, partial [Pristionchus fissidentatus]